MAETLDSVSFYFLMVVILAIILGITGFVYIACAILKWLDRRDERKGKHGNDKM